MLLLVGLLQPSASSNTTRCGILPVCKGSKLLRHAAEVALQRLCYARQCSIVLGTLLQLGQLQCCLPQHCVSGYI
jgi:hypothetical protein